MGAERKATKPLPQLKAAFPEQKDVPVPVRHIVAPKEQQKLMTFFLTDDCPLSRPGRTSLTEPEAYALLAVGGTASRCISHIRALSAAGKRFASFSHLVSALRASGRTVLEVFTLKNHTLIALLLCRARAVESRRAVVAFFQSSACTLLDQPMTAYVDLAAVDRLAEQSGSAGADLAGHLRRMQARGARFSLFADLVAAVREAQTAQDHRRPVRDYLFGGACSLLRDPERARKQAELNTADIDLLIELSGNSPDEAVRTLQSMEGFDMHFGVYDRGTDLLN
jgi:hypothetical protein